MGINKNFVVRNGLGVDENLIYADGIAEKVGIGTTNPQAKLDVAGSGLFSGNLLANGTLSASGVVNFTNTLESTTSNNGNFAPRQWGELSFRLPC